MTYSIAGMCRRTGQFGAAVTTSSIAVGSRVPFALAGVGIMLTQHQTDPRLGPKGIALLKEGRRAGDVITALTTSGDPHIERRQLAAVDRFGNTAAFHGSVIASIHGAAEGDGVIAVGNILRNDDVLPAMVEGFNLRPDEPLAERLLAGLEAGKAAGGEFKQEKSAVLFVVGEETFPLVDLRVDLDPNAIGVLRFLWDTYRPMVDMYLARAIAPDSPAANFDPSMNPPGGSAPSGPSRHDPHKEVIR